MRRFVKRPSPAMIVALVALFFSLSGNALAAVIINNSNQVRDGALTGADLAANTVRSGDVQGLTGADLTNGSIGLGELNPADAATLLRTTSAAGGDVNGTLAALSLAANSVAASEIQDGSVGAAEIGTSGVGTDELGIEAVRLGDLRVLFSERFYDHATSIANGTCTGVVSLPSTGQVSQAEFNFLTVGSRSVATSVRAPGGWSVVGAATVAQGQVNGQICNNTGSTADPPGMTITTMTIGA